MKNTKMFIYRKKHNKDPTKKCLYLGKLFSYYQEKMKFMSIYRNLFLYVDI